ncbi:GDP-mannose pyrophosphatase NudK [Dyadobacter sp. CY323]|uniref:GDP-mannose pyrophosphatase NudK n=1 Tax=Dyadobacter sp. CY323 TaxID=2907302 RepID=UPI001F3176CA|nr:GDP-mannose pyrophosphatase NudK [Dyadobacter sp. CY323]MCE6989104.1 GDP-mannose pyrophosphatase NudK [Dyadobacter sp. CY323]
MQNRVKVVNEEVLSNNWYTLRKYTFDYQRQDGSWERQSREAYDRGNGATILLYSTEKQTVILTRQFRLPTYTNGNTTGMLIEACAGLLDKDNAEDCIKRETEEETGYQIKSVKKIFEAYMSPGSVTEILYFFVAEYSDEMKIGDGGGCETEQENIEVMEIPFDEAVQMIATGEIKDAKTIMLIQYAQLHGLLTPILQTTMSH